MPAPDYTDADFAAYLAVHQPWRPVPRLVWERSLLAGAMADLGWPVLDRSDWRAPSSGAAEVFGRYVAIGGTTGRRAVRLTQDGSSYDCPTTAATGDKALAGCIATSARFDDFAGDGAVALASVLEAL